MKKILLGQLGSYGDCLYATTIARQIKTDYPGCSLTWAVGTIYRPILDGNPYIDEIWEIPVNDSHDFLFKWEGFEKKVLERKRKGDFDEVFLTQIAPSNYKNFDGTVRSSIFRGYPHPITVTDTPVVRLFRDEIENVRCFADKHRLRDNNHVIMFECSPSSYQSFVTPMFALQVAKLLIDKIDDVCIILSSNSSIESTDKRIIDGSELSFRENAELTKYCTLLVGCSSGISWICTSDWAKPLPMIQLLGKSKSVFASFIHDYEYRGCQTNEIIEMTDCSVKHVYECLIKVLCNGFSTARTSFNENIPVGFNHYASVIYSELLRKHNFSDALISLKYVYKRYGFKPQIIYLLFVNFKRHLVSVLSN